VIQCLQELQFGRWSDESDSLCSDQHAPPGSHRTRLKRLASARGWTNSDASARLVEEGPPQVGIRFH